MSSAGDVHGPPDADTTPSSKGRHHASPLDYRNGDLVSRLLAATPPYLYNMPLAPHSFFFSEMLRSFVQAKNEHQPVPAARAAPRRSRKRSWREASYERVKPALGPPPIMDKPLELTTSRVHSEESKPVSTSPVLPPAPPLLMPPCGFPPLPAPDSSMHSDMLLPPPPPMWYPSLYPLSPQPPYGIDPLHFFIDLRVSGHIWDRKMAKDTPADLSVSEGSPPRLEEKPPSRSPTPDVTPATSSSFSLVKQSKHCSAFSVPHPRSVSDKREVTHSGRGHTGTHYIFQNLPRIYQDVRGSQEPAEDDTPSAAAAAAASAASPEEGEEDKPKVKDLRALIGLELVVDYVQQDGEEEPNPGPQDGEDRTAHPEHEVAP